LDNLKRGFSEKGWEEVQGLVKQRLSKTGNRKYRPSAKQKPISIVW